ncbi:hypothetical protein MZD04_gp124 [Pseudomonas phage Psa21]|uniref:Uncharacterized protein n=1 Tax=Pseudomonas phage Psa21 TaxID=2530023 RepID=A0A481W4S4_9CAUD|nr:hypothetical protein MZD04_gp124 [Pseudomonas phage Psa21]QBJ02652.1 hypothetical protein PSA21_124 [Pseudomonas phage Psa21]
MTQTTIHPIRSFIEYITDAESVWDPTRYIQGRRLSDSNAEFEYMLTYSYLLGGAYMTGTFGKEGITVELWFRDTQGFQIAVSLDGKELDRFSYPPHATEEVIQRLEHLASA